MFKKWIDDDPRHGGDALSNRRLAEELFVTHQVIGRSFPGNQVNNKPWYALCFHVIPLYQQEGEAPPTSVVEFARTYEKWLDEGLASIGSDAARPRPGHDYGAMETEELITLLDTEDLLESSGTAAVLARRYHQELAKSTGLLDDPGDRWGDATKKAREIVDLAARVEKRVVTRDVLDDAVRRNCIPVFDAAADARRLLARDTAREPQELHFLIELRKLDLNITGKVRPPVEVALNTYYRDSAIALMESAPRGVVMEIEAVENLLDELARLGARAVLSGDGNHRAPPPPGVVEIDVEKVVAVAARIASFIVAYPEHAQRVRLCASRILKLFPMGEDRTDVQSLLKEAQAERATVMRPRSVLRITKFRGVGEILVARVLVAIAQMNFPEDQADSLISEGAEHPGVGSIEWGVKNRHGLYVPADDEATREVRVTWALERAAGLYGRAETWLRRVGVAGALREIAVTEGFRCRELLGQRDASTHRTGVELVRHVRELEERLEKMIAEGILVADLNALTNMRDRPAQLAAIRLVSTLQQTVRYLSKPELGLRTDLPPRRQA